MGSHSRLMSSAAVGGLVLLCVPAYAQSVRPVARLTALANPSATVQVGSLAGVVQDEKGAPVAGAMVSAFGASTAFAVADGAGHFEFRTLAPGSYLVRAHLSGFVASVGQVVDVRASARADSSIALRHVQGLNPVAAAFPVAEASVGAAVMADVAQPAEAVPSTAVSPDDGDHGETAWRINHARRGILRDATVPEAILVRDEPPANVFGRTVGSSARLAGNFFSGVPLPELSGQFNLLTTGSFDSPQQLFSGDSFAHSIAYMSLGAPVGQHADWSMRGALTEGDVSSWIVAAAYTTHAGERQRYNVGMSYSTQRYDNSNPAVLRDVADANRNVGEIYGFDTFTIARAVSLTGGARFSRYDYLKDGGLLSPRIGMTVTPAEHLRFSTLVERRALAPGAEEFLPPTDGPLWLPPQRTFSSLLDGRGMHAEHTNHMEFAVERDIAASTVSLRVFRQQVNDQLVTLFGVDMPNTPSAHLGHFFVANGGDVDAAGWSAAVRLALANRVHGSVEYSQTNTRWNSGGDLAYMVLVSPSATRASSERLYNVSASVEALVPETATRVIILARVGNGFASSGSGRPGVDSRFDVQVRQSLPFMDFSNTRWEMLVAVRNFYRDATADSSVYDELLVVRPPKRIVGGLALRF